MADKISPEVYRGFSAYCLGLAEGAQRDRGGLLSDIVSACRVAARKGPVKAIKSFRSLRYLRHRPAFDRLFYRLQMEAAGFPLTDPVTHYVMAGADLGLDPAPGFSTERYTFDHPDVRAGGVNPLYHYLRHGTRERRRVEPSDRIDLIQRSLTEGGVTLPTGVLDRANDLALTGAEAAEEADTHEWPLRDRPEQIADFGLYDIRPDDAVLTEAGRGDVFMRTHLLTDAVPQWRAAVAEINALGFKSPAKPDVSIIIPAYGQLAFTLNALHSLLAHRSRYGFEVLVGDDASPDDSETWLRQVEGIRYIRYVQNGGFIETCNRTAKEARGQYVVFLNTDTRVAEGWLDALIDSFTTFPNAGLVGSKLYYGDGTLQEAGGIVWRDAHPWNYGRGDDPNRPRYCYAREVDYVSGAAIALKRNDWDALGGFDVRYKPAYFEDTDLAMQVKAAGRAVILQPQSRAIHYEGVNSGKDIKSGVKASQKVNHQVFQQRWADTLQTHRAHGEKPWLERERSVERRVLIIDSCNPTPRMDAGSLATVNIIRAWQALGYHVSFVPEDNFLYEPGPVSELQAMGVQCFYAPYELSMTRLLKRYGALYDVVLLIRPKVAERNFDLVSTLCPRARVLYLNADLHFLRMQRQAAFEGSPKLAAEAEAMKVNELKYMERADAALVHSTHERNLLRIMAPSARVRVVPLIESVVENVPKAAGRTDIMFLGGYAHPPNVDAAEWLLDEIWPQLETALPQARLVLAGSKPPESLRARASDRIIVPGMVDRLEPLFAGTRVFVAPLRYGAGAKGKVVTALANGVPVVATPTAAEGMALEDGRTVFLAEDTDTLVAQIRRLYKAPAREWNALSAAGQAHIRTQHSLESTMDVLRELLMG